MPPDQFAPFWQMVKAALKPNGRVFFVDSLLTQSSTARNHAALDRAGSSQRKLNDGRAYRVVKIFHEPTQLQASLQDLGWTGDVDRTDNYFLHGLFAPKVLL